LEGKQSSSSTKYLMEKIIGNMGNAHVGLKNSPKALEFYDRQLAIARDIGDKEGELTVIGNMGNALFRMGDFHAAMKHYEEQLALARERCNRQAEGDALGNMGSTIACMGESAKAVELLIQAISIAREMGDTQREGIRLSSLGLRYSEMKDYANAIKALDSALFLARTMDYSNHEADALVNMAGIYRKLGLIGKAKELLDYALALYQSLNDLDAKKVENWLIELEEDEHSRNLHKFIRATISAARNKSADAEQYFEITSRMLSDSSLPIEIRDLAKVLRNVLVGINKPDLSQLQEDLARIVKEELEK
jgi:tetratricopeptide (TPR) repeat protein